MGRFSIFNYNTWKRIEFDSIVDARAYAIRKLSQIEQVTNRYGDDYKISITQGKQEIGFVYAHGPKDRRSYWYFSTRHPGVYYRSKELYKNGKIIRVRK